MKFSFVFFLSLLFIKGVVVSGQNYKPTQAPKLVVFLNIDELRTEHLITFSHKFSQFGFNQLIKNGTFYHRGNYKTTTSFRGTKLLNIHTGSYASTHGVIGSAWYNAQQQSEEKASYFYAPNAQVQPDSGQIIFPRLNCSTISDELNIFYKGKSKVAAVSLSPEMLAYQGFLNDELTFWLNRTTGRMINNSDSAPPNWAQKYNDMNFADMYIQRQWGPASDLNDYHEYISKGPMPPRHFMYDMKERDPLFPYQKIIGSPFGNVLLRDFVASLIINEELGKDKYPDLLTISLSCKPFVDRPQEMFDVEMEDMLIRLDEQIESIIQLVRDDVGLEHTLFVLSSTPSIGWLPQTLAKNNVSTGIFNGKKTSALLNLYLMAIYGQGKWVAGYNDKQFYFNHKLLNEKQINLEEIQDKAANFLLEVRGIDKTITAYHLRVNEYTTGIFNEYQQNYFHGRSGDLFISLKPGWTEEINGYKKVSLEQNFYTPLIFFGWNVNSTQVLEPVNMIDVAPTLSTILQIPEPNGCVGEPLQEVVQ
ncbi:alkaline phosphatase family protein [Saccharicrinis carchari]|nr:alkaline phosphatase family protein [Saccharicrinis carchari]